MATAYVFLQRLGLDEDADARAIRRAYARELKRIDQEADPDAFQQLRASYETALDWAAWRASQAQADEVQADEVQADQVQADQVPHHGIVPDRVAPDAIQAALALDASLAREAAGGGDAAPAPTPYALGSLVFEDFAAGMPALARYRGEVAEQAWSEALQAALADGRLLNFDARLRFEQDLAQMLAAGWRSGHEVLFPVASEVFGWDRDRRTLGRLGQAGRLLDLALEERAGFASQDAETRAQQREALALVRGPEAAAERMIRRVAPVLEQMAQRFPYWLPVIAPADKIGLWHAHCADKGRAFEVVEAQLPRAGTPRRIGMSWVLAIIVAVAIVIGNLGTGDPPPAYDSLEPFMQDLAQGQPPLRERLDEIVRRIDYRPGPHVAPGPQHASVEVFLDRDGKVIDVARRAGAVDPAYTAAVEQAIRESKPFPRETVKRFTVAFETAFSPNTGRRGESLPDWARPHAPAPATPPH